MVASANIRYRSGRTTIEPVDQETVLSPEGARIFGREVTRYINSPHQGNGEYHINLSGISSSILTELVSINKKVDNLTIGVPDLESTIDILEITGLDQTLRFTSQ